MLPTVTRAELDSDDIIREVGVDRPRSRFSDSTHAYGTPLAGCQGKTKYPNKAAAEKSTRRGLVTYKCKYCRNWHTGNPSGK